MIKISKTKEVGIWLLFVPIAIYLLPLSINQIINQPMSTLHFGLFLLLTIFIAAFPVRIKDNVFNLIQGISLSTLLIFGLLPELLLSFVGILVVLLRSKVGSEQHYRYPINIFATWIASAVSAGAYYLSIQVFRTTWTAPYYILSMAIYLVTYNIINQILAVIVGKYIYNLEKVSLTHDDLMFSIKVTLVMLPSAFIVVFLYSTLGTQGIISASLPFITISAITQYYYQGKMNNQYLMNLTKKSQVLAKKKDKISVVNSFMEYILEIFPSKQIYYFKIVNGKFGVLDNISSLDTQGIKYQPEVILTEQSPLMEAYHLDEMKVFHLADEWRNMAYYNKFYYPESAIALPIRKSDTDAGIIVITHPQKNVYDELLTSMIGMFYQYFLIVLEKLNEFKLLEDTNQTDYLTKLPNLRGFYNYFDEIEKKNAFQQLSLIVLDLDHFKLINDTHGHAAGNDVLMKVAKVLNRYSNEKVFVARFGGEEFIVLVQNLSKQEVYKLAEQLRQTIEETVFSVTYSIETGNPENLHVTASFGIATYPDDIKDVHSLVQLADRAMYLGSKQNGRNKITVHEEER